MNQDEKPHPILPKYTTLPASDVSESYATLNAIVGDVSDYDEDSEDDYTWRSLRGVFVYSTSKDFENYSTTNTVKVVIGQQCSQPIYGLESNTTYYYKFVYSSNYSSQMAGEDLDYLWNVESFKTR